ncbi:MAG TPA: Bax inhibitor-1 family protein [Candidatus Binatia bacterium]|nr:Bax inhibitor-1 family protein [Candidatus Binatia bacterium]
MNTEHYSPDVPVIELNEQSRGQFIARTYGHLFGAIVAFTLLEIAFFKSGLAQTMTQAMMSVSWLWVLGGFVVVSWVARAAAHRASSMAAQYAALAGYVLAEAIIFVPLLYFADQVAAGVIASAAVITLLGFASLTALVFATRKDFSFLRGILMWGGIVAIVLIVGGALFGFQLGTYFSVAMVALAGGAILYDTSNVLHHYPQNRHVAASLELFASVALMFWYVLRILMSRR